MKVYKDQRGENDLEVQIERLKLLGESKEEREESRYDSLRIPPQ